MAGAETAAEDEVWGGYRYAVILIEMNTDWLKVIDLGAAHSSSGGSERVISTKNRRSVERVSWSRL